MSMERVRKEITWIMALALVLAWMLPIQPIFAASGDSTANMTINASGVLTAYTGNGGAVAIPSNVTSIGTGAFSGKPITSVTIPNSVRSIGSNAFSNCTSLTNVTIPNSVTEMGSGVFSGCTGLTSISLQAGIPSIPDSTFEGCSSLSSVAIASGVSNIGSNAFSGCSSLATMAIPSGVTGIGSGAFANCTGLTGISIPSTTTSIGSGALNGCTNLNTIKVEGGNSAYASDGGCLYNAAMTKLLLVPMGQSSVSLYSGTKIIGTGAFNGCTNVHTLTVPSGANKIESGAFTGSGLTEVTIPASVKSIGAQSGWQPEIIYGYSNSAAETFAGTSGYVFSALDGGNSKSSTEKATTEVSTTGGDTTSVDISGNKNKSGSTTATINENTRQQESSGNDTATETPAAEPATTAPNNTATTGSGGTTSTAAPSGTGNTASSNSGAYSSTTSNNHTLDQTPKTADGTIDPLLFLIAGLVLIGCGFIIVGKRRGV